MTKTNYSQQGFAFIETVLVLVILAIVGGTGYYIYNANNKTTDTYDAASNSAATVVGKNKAATKPASLTATEANKLVSTTYGSYITTTSKDVSRNAGSALPTLKQNFTSDLYNKLTKVQGYDPLTCAQEAVPSFKTALASNSSKQANVTVKEAFNTPLTVNVSVNLQAGKIDAITCQR